MGTTRLRRSWLRFRIVIVEPPRHDGGPFGERLRARVNYLHSVSPKPYELIITHQKLLKYLGRKIKPTVPFATLFNDSCLSFFALERDRDGLSAYRSIVIQGAKLGSFQRSDRLGVITAGKSAQRRDVTLPARDSYLPITTTSCLGSMPLIPGGLACKYFLASRPD